jgi:hypothetical protein
VLIILLLAGSIGGGAWIKEKFFSVPSSPTEQPSEQPEPEPSQEPEKEREEKGELSQLNQEFQRIITNLRTEEISGETITLPLRTSEQRKKQVGLTNFQLCAVNNCDFTTQGEYCFRHACQSSKCGNLVVAYRHGLAKYCADCLSK